VVDYVPVMLCLPAQLAYADVAWDTCRKPKGSPLVIARRLPRPCWDWNMSLFICSTCGAQYPPSDAPPDACLICTDERQYVPSSGQAWTTLQALQTTHSNKFRRLAPGLTTIETTPAFAIGQRAFLARTPAGNVLWECLALVDDATIDVLKGLGGVTAIAISHPHFYTSMAEWSRALGGVPIYVHAADRQWVTRPDPAIHFWEGDTKSISPGVTLIRLGGHFEGGTVFHWADWNEGRGVLLSGDILQVVPSRHVSFMWSYPNLIPLSASKVKRMAAILEPFGKLVVAESVARYIARISET
jgi:glyoxylase-like metal-dependent hydrolase (beta-lactamase superfamily II)